MNRVFFKSCESMAEIADGTVQTCVTSPPYFGLRDYGVEGQIGLEPTLDAYVERLVRVFREVRRVLRDDGTLWLNLGDSYASTTKGSGGSAKQGITTRTNAIQKFDEPRKFRLDGGVKEKDLIGVPWAVAFALRADGWWLRSDIVWHKVPCMPESIEDRPTRAHEFIFLLSKSARYFYDAEAIREPLSESSLALIGKENGPAFGGKRAAEYGNGTYSGKRYKVGSAPSKHESNTDSATGYKQNALEYEELKGANKRDVWRITPAQYAEAHFATFPPEIPSLCIRAGSKPGDLVLDPFAGSGTTLEVAESLGRAWVGYELNLAYKPLIDARLRQRGLFAAGP